MKNLLLTLALTAGCLTYSSAQQINTVPQSSADVGMEPIKQGNWMVGGSIGSLGYSFESESFNIQVNPRAGYFISDGVAIGAQANLGFRTSDADADNVWGYGIAPFVRYYFPGGASATGRFFGQGDIGIGGSSAGDDVALNLGLNAGYAHFITQTVALEVTAGYNYSKANINAQSDKQSGLGVAVGFQIYLPGRNR
ncbi:porin family protein [Sphingobacterium lactis]|uniref:Outer membrane protein beta-barrel domain-containing protein n=1 Tax=Sphingobacterium lactis TaxID=797291 RepID=A0A1H6AZ28_9SPHI|nr:hypothetical protein [Sphingobacterium lactis]SEG53285.1 hypothetical protein SAMN05421877_10935 [Sphingobacterium lactis]